MFCPPDWDTMPHMEADCPRVNGASNADRVGHATSARILSRLVDNHKYGKDTGSKESVMQAALRLDTESEVRTYLLEHAVVLGLGLR